MELGRHRPHASCIERLCHGGGLDLFDGSSITDDTVNFPVGYSFVGSHGFGAAGYSGGLAELISGRPLYGPL